MHGYKVSLTKLEMSLVKIFSSAADTPFFSIFSINLDEYSMAPNLTGKLLSYIDMIVSIACKLSKELWMFETRFNYGGDIKYKRISNLAWPQVHTQSQDREHKLHGTNFCGCSEVDQGKLASKAAKAKHVCYPSMLSRGGSRKRPLQIQIRYSIRALFKYKELTSFKLLRHRRYMASSSKLLR